MSLSSERLFDKAEADALLPILVELIRRLQEAVGSDAAAEGRERLAHAGRSNGSPEAAASVFQAAAKIQALLDEVDEMDVILHVIVHGIWDPVVRDVSMASIKEVCHEFDAEFEIVQDYYETEKSISHHVKK